MEEKTFFEYEGVKVTNTRFVTDGQTFAMSNVTSVKAFEQPPKWFGGILILVIGVIISSQSLPIGIVIIALAAFYMYKQKTIFHVMLTTSGGESSALKTHQREYLNKVVSALNEAIVYRG